MIYKEMKKTSRCQVSCKLPFVRYILLVCFPNASYEAKFRLKSLTIILLNIILLFCGIFEHFLGLVFDLMELDLSVAASA